MDKLLKICELIISDNEYPFRKTAKLSDRELNKYGLGSTDYDDKAENRFKEVANEIALRILKRTVELINSTENPIEKEDYDIYLTETIRRESDYLYDNAETLNLDDVYYRLRDVKLQIINDFRESLIIFGYNNVSDKEYARIVDRIFNPPKEDYYGEEEESEEFENSDDDLHEY